MTKGERIKEIRLQLGDNGKKMTLEEFGQRLGVSKNAISNIENGNRNLTDQMCKSICREFGVSEEWLLTGNGHPWKSKKEDVASIFASENGLSSIEESLIREYLNLSEHDRSVFRKYLKRVILDITAADEEPTIDEKVASYRAELEAEAANSKLGASQTGNGKEA